MMTVQSRDAVLRISSGLVTKARDFDAVAKRFEPNGLYGEDVFGPVPTGAGAEWLSKDDRTERWGHLELAVASRGRLERRRGSPTFGCRGRSAHADARRARAERGLSWRDPRE
jgi:hypothetical protein